MEFVVSDESINRDGFRTLTDGIRLKNFLKNPVMHFNHRWGSIPIGRWENLRKENGQLIGTPVFNEKDPFALQIKEAVEGKFINATSIGADPITFSSDPQYIIQGQTAESLIESDLFEISFTDLPANVNAVRLNSTNKDFKVPKLKQPQKQELKMKKIALSLGLKEDASEEQILAAIEKIEKEDSKEQRVKVLIALGVANGHVNDFNKEHFTKLAKSDFDTVFEMIGTNKENEAAPSGGKEGEEEDKTKEEPITMSKMLEEFKKINLGGDTSTDNETDAAKFLRLSKENPTALGKMEREDNEQFVKLNKAYIASFKK